MAGLDPAIHSAGAEADGEACEMDPGLKSRGDGAARAEAFAPRPLGPRVNPEDTREPNVGWAKRKRAHAGTGGMDPGIGSRSDGGAGAEAFAFGPWVLASSARMTRMEARG
jgi:hypothetical protein